jgi:hypothetical protein
MIEEKNAFILRKLRKYVGPKTSQSDPKKAKSWNTLAEKIRLTADDVFLKIQVGVLCYDHFGRKIL